MSSLALKWSPVATWRIGWGIAAILASILIMQIGTSINQILAVLMSSIVLIIWSQSKPNGFIAALLFFFVKPVFVRMAYAVDTSFGTSDSFDLLGITPALLLAGLIIWHLYMRMSSGEKITVGRTRLLIVLFSVVAFASILNPANSVMLGLGGFERNVLPNMMVLLTASFVFADILDAKKLLKALILLGLASCVYGIGQYFPGLYPWEKGWILNVAFKESSAGWLTTGLRGVEFRLFSFFFNYMDFTFSNALIFTLAISFGTELEGMWKKVRILYIILWFIVLLLSLERMPLLMSIVAMAAVYYLNSEKRTRKRIVWKVATLLTLLLLTLSLASPYLKSTGADKLIRLAELANPFAAASIEDRMFSNWTPTLQTITANPLGVGIGYGSQTRANSIAARSDFWVEPHNELLQKTLETGIFGGIIFLLLGISVFRDGLRLSRSYGPEKRLGIGFVAGTIGFWLCGMVNVPFSGSSGLLYWTIAGVVLSLSESANKATLIDAKKNTETADISSS